MSCKFKLNEKVICITTNIPLLTRHKIYEITGISADEPYYIYIIGDDGEEVGWKEWVFEKVVEIK